MELPQSVIRRLVDTPAERPAEPQVENRRAARKAISTCLPFALVQNGVVGEATAVLARNISLTGLSVLRSSPLAVGDHFVVWFADEEGKLAVHGLITWIEVLGRSSYLAGGRFTSIGSEIEGSTNQRRPLFAGKSSGSAETSEVADANLPSSPVLFVPD